LGFTGSLHPLSVVDGIRAAALRTPARTAIVNEDGTRISYTELMAATGRSPLVQWLAAMSAQPSTDENRSAAIPQDPALSHRALLLQALERIVVHAAFDRDGHMALTLPLSGSSAYVAATISLWLGGTLHLLPPGSIERLAEGIAQGRFDTCWIGAADFEALENRAARLPPPSERFVLALCDGAPASSASQRLAEWLGPGRVSQ
jgi:hypothetical protein